MARRPSIGLTVALTLFLTGVSSASDRIVVLLGKVWSVSPEGQIESFPYKFPAGSFGGVFGSTEPLPSPNSRWIVFSRDLDCTGYPFTECGNDLHLLEVESGRERRITSFGQPRGAQYASVDVLMTVWSTDSRQILFSVVPGETSGAAEEWGHDLLVRKADYGFHIYDLATATIHSVTLPKDFQFQAWLPDGSFLGAISKAPPCAEKLLKFRFGDTQGADVGAPNGSLDQVKVSSDGKWIIGYMDGGCQQPETAQLIKIDLSDMAATPVVPLAAWAENQWPDFSPDGDHISYVHQQDMVEGIYDESLIVDGRPVYACRGSMNYKWVDERSIAAACENEVVVLDVSTRTVLSRLMVPPARY